MTAIGGLLFDKDGTLFDFLATWGSWTRDLIGDLSRGGPPGLGERLGAAAGYDLSTGRFAPDSPIIAHTPGDIAAVLLPLLPGRSLAELVGRMNALSALAGQVEAVPLRPLFARLRARGLRLGVATNDAEGPARAHLSRAGIAGLVDFVAGCDSGWGAKPAPGPLFAFASRVGLRPAEVAMVGDSRNDLVAGRAAGMRTVGVLTGPAGHAELAPLADVVLPDIGHLPGWLDGLAVAAGA
ncbi:MAG: HAD family hydrolase [Paracoccaceae bacterium]